MGAFWALKWLDLGTRWSTRGEKATLAKSLFYQTKTMLFKVWGVRGRIQIEPKTCSESSSENNAFLFIIFEILGPKLEPKWIRFGAQIDRKTRSKINAKIYAKMRQNGARNGKVGGRGVARCGGGEGEVNLPLSSEEDGFEKQSDTPNPVLRKLCGGSTTPAATTGRAHSSIDSIIVFFI